MPRIDIGLAHLLPSHLRAREFIIQSIDALT